MAIGEGLPDEWELLGGGVDAKEVIVWEIRERGETIHRSDEPIAGCRSETFPSSMNR